MTLGNDNGTDGQTDRQTECDAICGPHVGRIEGRIINVTDDVDSCLFYCTVILLCGPPP